MNAKRTNKQYTTEFKQEAVALVHDQGYTVAEAAKSLGIGTSLLTSGRKKLKHNALAAHYKKMSAPNLNVCEARLKRFVWKKKF